MKKALYSLGLLALLSLFVFKVFAAGENVLVLPQHVIENQTLFDNIISKARLTGGGESDYQVVSVPLNAGFQPMLEVPTSDILTSLQSQLSSSTRSDGAAFQDGDLNLLFALKDSSYSVVVRTNVELQLNGTIVPAGTVFTGANQVLPVVRDYDVTILIVTDELLADLSEDIEASNLPAVGDFVVAQVYSINSGERYRLTSIGLEGSILIWVGQIENHEPEELNPITGSQSDNRPPNTPVSNTYSVRIISTLNLTQRIDSWLSGEIVVNEENCFTLDGVCSQQGHNGNLAEPYLASHGTMLGITLVGDEYVIIVGYESQTRERYTIAYTAGSTSSDYLNGLNVIYFSEPVIHATGRWEATWLVDEGYVLDEYLNHLVGSPVFVTSLTSTPNVEIMPKYLGYLDWFDDHYPQAIELKEFLYQVTYGNQSPYVNSPWYMNTIPTTNEGLVAVGSISLARYV